MVVQEHTDVVAGDLGGNLLEGGVREQIVHRGVVQIVGVQGAVKVLAQGVCGVQVVAGGKIGLHPLVGQGGHNALGDGVQGHAEHGLLAAEGDGVALGVGGVAVALREGNSHIKGVADVVADDLILEAVNEGVAAQRQVVAGGGAAGKGYAIHRAGIVDVYGVAALGCPVGDVLGGGVLVQQGVDLGLDLGLGGLDIGLGKRQRGYIIRQGHIVQCADAGPVAVIVQPFGVIEVGVVEIRHLAVGGHACAGCGRVCRGAALLFEQHKAGRSYAQHSSHRAQHTQQDLGNAFQKRYLLKIADRFHGECKYHTILL